MGETLQPRRGHSRNLSYFGEGQGQAVLWSAQGALHPGLAFWKQVYFSASWLRILSAGKVLQLCSLRAAEPTGKAFPSAAPPPSPAWAALPAPCGSALSAGCAAFSTSLI